MSFNKDNTQEQLRGTFVAAIAAYEKDNPPKTTRQIGLDMGIPDDYNKRDNVELIID